MEVLAIVAYNQPVTKSFVEQIRGVDSSSTVNTLVERGCWRKREGWICQVARFPTGQRHIFLRSFGLTSIGELPLVPQSGEEAELEGQVRIEETQS